MGHHSTALKPGPRYQMDQAYHVKVALFDVDNTLVGNESPELPSERFRTAVRSARGKIAVGLIGARPLSKMAHILEYIEAEGLSILCNGAQIINNADRSVVAEWIVDLKTCDDVTTYLHTSGATYWINDGGVDHFSNANRYEKLANVWDQHGARLAVPDYRPIKPYVIVAHDVTDQQVAEIGQFVREHGDDDVTSFIAHETKQPDGTMLYDLFIAHKNANKQFALRDVARRQGLVVDEIMVVGDGRNDTVVISEAGVGVAVGNAAQQTLEVATFIAPNREADGAAIALEFAAAELT